MGHHLGETILVVDDEELLRERMGRAFESRGLEAFLAANYDEAIAQARENGPELAVLDLRMPGRSGLELIPSLLELNPAMKIVILTGYGSIATALHAVRLGAVHYLVKPADADEILAAFDKDAENQGLEEKPDIQVPSLARIEREHIERVLDDCGGNITKAAKLLGIHRRSLQRKLAKYPVSR